MASGRQSHASTSMLVTKGNLEQIETKGYFSQNKNSKIMNS